MNRVTIGNLVDDFITSPIEERDKTRDIEVVPRKVVEDIIDYAKQVHDAAPESEGKQMAAEDIIGYAESCLKDFEEGEET